MKKIFGLWWAFFWRYVITFFILLFLLAFFSGVQNGIYLEVFTSAHVVVNAITMSDEILIRIINAVCHIVASFISIALIANKR